MPHRHASLRRLVRRLLHPGGDRRLVAAVVDLARLPAGSRVLDLGCGEGELALDMARQVGPEGTVHGVDPSAERVEAARARAAGASGPTPVFEVAGAEALPFGDAAFDRVVAVRMMHHLAPEARERALAEARRVLAPGGEALVVDFPPRAEGARRGLVDRARHALMAWVDPSHGEPVALEPLLAGTGFLDVASGDLDRGRMRWARGRRA